MKKLLKSILFGIGWGCTLFVAIGIVFSLFAPENLVYNNFIKQAICSIVVGLGYSIPSLIYQNDKLSLAMKAIFHMGIGFMVYIIVGFYANWFPVEMGIGVMVFTISTMIVISIAMWIGFYFYYRYEAKLINENIKSKNL